VHIHILCGKDIVFEMPVQLSHPATLPAPPSTDQYPVPGMVSPHVDLQRLSPQTPITPHLQARALGHTFQAPAHPSLRPHRSKLISTPHPLSRRTSIPLFSGFPRRRLLCLRCPTSLPTSRRHVIILHRPSR
jgi:hypothetical protein